MTFELKPDYEQSRARYLAFWEREIIDRPPVCVTLPKPEARPYRGREYASWEEKWLDIDGRIEEIEAGLENTEFLYDALPVAWPNLGPGIFSAWCGCPYEFGKSTAWAHPAIRDWERDFGRTRLDTDHPLFRKLIEFTEKLLSRGRGRYIVGLTDFHPGGDHIAALRGAQTLAVDLLESPDRVKQALARAEGEYYAAYGVFYRMVHGAGMPTTSWTPLINDGTYYIPSNDFSCMISREMFNEFFLPGIARECAFCERSIYHLDGPGALRHLDALLDIKELDAVQWVCGAGNGGYHKWADVYRSIQAAKKGIQLMCHVRELDQVFETLKPEGVWFSNLYGITDRETAEYAVKRISRWK